MKYAQPYPVHLSELDRLEEYMGLLDNLSMRWKLLLSFGSVLLLLSSQQVVFEKSFQTLNHHETAMSEVSARIEALMAKDIASHNVPRAANRAILTGLPDDIKRFEAAKQAALDTFSTPLPPMEGQPDQAAELANIRAGIEKWSDEIIAPTLEKRQQVESGKITMLEVIKYYTTVSKGPQATKRSEQIAALIKVERDHAEDLKQKGQQERNNLSQLNWMIFLGCFMAGMGVAFLVSSRLAARMAGVVEALEGMAKGDFHQNLTVDGADEIRRIQVAINEVSRSIGEKVTGLQDALKVASSGDFSRDYMVTDSDPISQTGDSLNQLLASLRASLGAVLEETEKLAVSSQQVRSVSQNIQTAAYQTSRQSNAAASGSEEVSRNVQTVAAAAEEMSASIREIAKNAADAARVATEAVKAASTAS
ncbi:MAG: HAMP domain-containing protein, partial [bacterium]